MDTANGDIGSWEKHTKGIGSKLLKKFGFKGRLGANEDGIATHIEVKARPQGVGLGFATEEKPTTTDFTNRKSDKNDMSFMAKAARWGGIETIAQSGSWKKGKERGGGAKAKVVTVADLLMKEDDEKQTIIIDMRSKETRVLSNLHGINDKGGYEDGNDDGLFTSNAKLGIEFLYNLNQIYEQVQSDVERDSRAFSVQTKRMDAIRINIKEIENQLQRDEPRLDRLEKIYKVLERVHDTQVQSPHAVTMEAIVRLFQTLYTSFAEEFRLFGLINLLPSIAIPIIHNKIKDWDPLQDPFIVADLFNGWSSLINYFEDNGEATLRSDVVILRESLGNSLIVPLIQRSITNNWDCRSCDPCLSLVDGLKQILSEGMYDQFVETALLPKLAAAVGSWNPHEDLYIHKWLHPWLPLLGSKLSILYPDIRRKISKRLGEWHPSDDTAQILLEPWSSIFDTSSLNNLVIRSIIPKLIVCIRGMVMDPDKEDGDLSKFHWITMWNRVIPPMHFFSLLAGEFFPRWLLALGQWLTSSRSPKLQWQVILNWYLKWKSIFPQEILIDEEIVRYLNVALEMMAAALDSSPHISDRCIRGYMKSMEGCSYFQVLEMKKLKADITERLTNINKPNSASVHVKFHEVVEAFAIENNIDFFLTDKQSNDHKIYQFGTLEIVIDSNVVFYSKEKKELVPISLEDLLVLSRHGRQSRTD